MHGAYYEHDTLISHQFSITNIGLLLYGCMWSGTLGHIHRHPSRTSPNNNKHTTNFIPVLILILQTWPDSTILTLSNSGCIYLVDGEVRYMVYRWGFPYLDYPLNVLISWSRRLSLFNWFCIYLHYTYTVDELHIFSLIWFKHDFMYT